MKINNLECDGALVFYKKYYVAERLANFQIRVHEKGFDNWTDANLYRVDNSNFLPGSLSKDICSGKELFRNALWVGAQIDFSSCDDIKFL